ncbi:MAG: acetolactate synthase 2 catalytic subunit [Gammaproteobacteria bacterium]|nr:acetolactate synthase 2 catalytic subunit [Gammaproteobacteria bacterium]
MTGAEYLLKCLEQQGVECIFGYPGGAIMPVYDALYDSSIRHYLCRHEQGAALAADGFARASSKVGVCLATSGPGATNLITGLANAFMDSIPMVAITGQVASHLMGTDAFQEIDTFGLSMAVVKHSFLIESPIDIAAVVNAAFALARDGRPGPVLIDFPKDIQMAEVAPVPIVAELTANHEQHDSGCEVALSAQDIEQFWRMLSASCKPLLYVGGGIKGEVKERLLQQLIAQLAIPMVTTLNAVGFASEHSLNLGMLGMHGHVAANVAVQECDLLLAFGVRFDDRATGNLAKFAPHAKVIHIDVDASELAKLRQPHLAIQCDLAVALEHLNSSKQLETASLHHDAWRENCRQQKQQHVWQYNNPAAGIYAPRLLRDISARCPDNTIFTCDVGQHQMWVAQHCQFSSPRHHLSSGGLGTMGFGLPAAIGAMVACPEATVINVTGDGSFAMNVQELMTLKRYQLPLKILLIDNQSLGMVRQWQHLFFKDRFSEIDLSDNPDFVTLGHAFGLAAKRIESAEQESAGIDWLLAQTEPSLLQVCISNQENVWPLVPPGSGNHEMLKGEHQNEKN